MVVDLITSGLWLGVCDTVSEGCRQTSAFVPGDMKQKQSWLHLSDWIQSWRLKNDYLCSQQSKAGDKKLRSRPLPDPAVYSPDHGIHITDIFDA